MKSRLFPFIVLLFFVQTAFCQTLKGIIVDKNETPILGASVSCRNSHAHTSYDGVFELNTSLPDTLYIECFGYEQKKVLLTQASYTLKIVLKEKVFQLEDVVITHDLKSTSTSANIQLQTNPVSSSQEILRTVPGIMIGQHAGGGKAEQIFLRGFDLDHGTDIKLSVDGIPVNMVSHAHGQGYADLHFVIPETVEKIDYAKGSYTAEQGNFNTAGYVDFQTRNKLDQNMGLVEIGMFNSQRYLSMFNVYDKAQNHAYAAVEYTGTDGYFQSNQNFRRVNLFGKYSGLNKTGGRTQFTASHFTSSWDASGQIPHRAVDNGSIGWFGAINDTEGGTTSRTNLALSTTHFPSDKLVIKNSLYFSHYDFELFSNFTFFERDSLNGDQIKQVENRNILGGESKIKQYVTISKGKLYFEEGVGFRYDKINDNELSYTKSRETTLQNVQLGDVEEINSFAFVSANWELGSWLINPGLRIDQFNFVYADQLALSKLSQTGRVLSPKLNFIYQKKSSLQYFFKNGYGFHSNDSRVVVQQTAKRTLPRSFSSDLGIIIKPIPSLIINFSLWQLFLEQEFVYVGDEGIVELSGKTQRSGVEFDFKYEIISGLFIYNNVNATLARSIDDKAGENYIPLAPSFINTGGLSYKSSRKIAGNIQYRYLANRPANEDYSLTADGYFIVDGNINYTLRDWTIGLVVQNILNTKWKETQFATTSRLKNETEAVEEIHFTPGTPFNLRLKLVYRF